MSTILFSIFCYYSIFCVATAITAHFTIYKPIIKIALERNLGEEIDECINSKLYVMALFLASILAAPGVIYMSLTGPDEEFIDSFIEHLEGKFED
jgi:hypothetical protein